VLSAEREGGVTTEDIKKEGSDTKGIKEIVFKCRFCQETKPYSEMVVLTRFFPPITACQNCSLKINRAKEEEDQEVQQDADL
jgi:hypothetical protein